MNRRGRPESERSLRVMALLTRHGPMSAREIAAAMRLTMPQTTTVLRNLKRRREVVVVDHSPIEGRPPVFVYAVACLR